MTCPSEGLLPSEAGWLEPGPPMSCSLHPAQGALFIHPNKRLGSPPTPAQAWNRGKCSGNAGGRQGKSLGEGNSLLQKIGYYCLSAPDIVSFS